MGNGDAETSRILRSGPQPVPLHSRAVADLRFIRETMAGAVAYTTLSGWGLLIVGFGALVTGFVAARVANLTDQLLIWTADAGISLVVGCVSCTLKARAAGQPLFAGSIRKFSLSFVPALLAGAVLTWVIIDSTFASQLPGIWLLLYGVGLASAGAQSARVIPATGAAFLCLGAISLIGPPHWRETLLWAGFGGLHVALGAAIVWRHGG